MLHRRNQGAGTGRNMDACVTEQALLENVTELKILSSAVISVAQLLKPEKSAEWVEVNLEEGFGMMKRLDLRAEAHIVNNIYFAGSIFPPHRHPGMEIIIVYKGRVELNLIEKKQTIIVGEGHRQLYYWDATTPHSGYFPVDCALYAITMPPDKTWPK